MSAVLSALTSLLVLTSPDPQLAARVLFWTLGGFASAQWKLLPLPVIAMIVGLGVMLVQARRLNLLMAGGGAALVERVGRRPLWMFSTGAMLVCFAGLLGTSAGFAQTGKTSIGFASVAFIFLSCEFGTFLQGVA